MIYFVFFFSFVTTICLRNRTTLHFDFLPSFMVSAQTYAFLVQGSLVTNQQKRHFSAVSLHFSLPFGFYLYVCAVENPEISGFCVSKSRGLRTDHKGVKKKLGLKILKF